MAGPSCPIPPPGTSRPRGMVAAGLQAGVCPGGSRGQCWAPPWPAPEPGTPFQLRRAEPLLPVSSHGQGRCWWGEKPVPGERQLCGVGSQPETLRSPRESESSPRGGPGRQHASVPCPGRCGSSPLPRQEHGHGWAARGAGTSWGAGAPCPQCWGPQGSRGFHSRWRGQGWEPSPSCTHGPAPTLTDTTHPRTSGGRAPLGSPCPAPGSGRAAPGAAAQDHDQRLQGRRPHHLPGQPVPVSPSH